MPVPLWPALASIFSALTDWIGVASGRLRVEYAAKPAAIVFLLVWALVAVPSSAACSLPAALFLLALTLSLAGDILLMLPSARLIAGLLVFLLAHLAYILAFNWGNPVPAPFEVIPAAAVVLILAGLMPTVRAGLRRSGQPRLVAPVAIYAVVLGAMLWSSLSAWLRPTWLAAGAGWVALGGIAFFASDASLIWDRYVHPIPGRRVTTHMLYHLAQFSLTAGLISTLQE